jgi:uncharacterized protein YcaQ
MGYAAERAARRAALIEGGRLIPVAVEGLKGERFIVAEDVEHLARAEREIAAGQPPGGAMPGVTFLAPLDPLCWDRDLLRRLFGFDYVWEVYVPEAKRRWGYYVLPILFGDRLVGRIEPRLDRREGTLRVIGLWWEPGFDPLEDPGFVPAFVAALIAHRDFADLGRVELPAGTRHRAFGVAVRATIRALGERRPRGRSTRAPVGPSARQATTQEPSRRRTPHLEGHDG